MRHENLQAIAPRRFVPRTTDSNHDSRVSPNLLKEAAGGTTAAGQVIAGDITYICLRDGDSTCHLGLVNPDNITGMFFISALNLLRGC